tara:strand:- start:98 stop:316 length:219 start_codon:yes stop_codon:yes gene_type:complete
MTDTNPHAGFPVLPKQTSMTREEKIQRYIESVIEGMDWKAMYHYVYESIEESLSGDTDAQIDEMYNYHFNDE